MPLEKGKSKSAFEHNIKAEMHAGKPMKQSLAIAYNIKRHAKKRMAEGGEVNESLHPEHENPDAIETQNIGDEHLGMKAQEHEDLAEPAEPMEHVEPMKEDMGRSDADISRIMRAVKMAMGGSVDEQHKPMPNEDRALAMNDTYPPGAAESDTQAQDEGFGEGPMNNEMGDEDQEEVRRKTRMSRALESVRRMHQGYEG